MTFVDAWAAGIIDGEGCISIRKCGPYYALSVVVGQSGKTVPAILKKLKVTYGGSVGNAMLDPRGGRQPKWHWQVVAKTAEDFLRAIQPHLVGKKAQADLALKYRELVGKPGFRTTERNRRAVAALHLRLRSLKNYRKTHDKWKVKDASSSR